MNNEIISWSALCRTRMHLSILQRRMRQTMKNIKLASRETKQHSIVEVGDLKIGQDFLFIAGPCSVESEEQMLETGKAVKEAGANMLRGGAFKPRTSPYAFQGLGLKGLKILEKTGKAIGLPVVTEVLDTRDVSWVCEYADVLQIGARNMQNFSLLKEVGKTQKPIILKRGMYSTLEEWLNCAEYILHEGNPQVILCERGIRTFETYTRNTLDLSAVPALKELTHLPVIIDPTHGTGRVSLIPPMSLAAVVAGADGLAVEVHNHPEIALSDKDQALRPEQFIALAADVLDLKAYMDRKTTS
ncbi:3-deoxy-7-phosphoheptulonate synthase [candidate division KSB3 bacterium]|uniref:3-deoxy-7-phosphoheptulonate synthase n=1 Tax=candidate division KSB3 bacterium TaxID=2044937 RepID=A0A2G6E8C6_9BACT|nr:MAG: 3-deoxy-7-phosphoheptulonate synthase [candidate division KSB3 bacterium]PIE30650.1 MAG: 3-deoxy-7-phosphoheptulonate synthase [candidate division KSB3 bacterium]